MKKLVFGLSCVCVLYLCGCQKNDCQTFLQGSWKSVNPLDSSYIAKDSLIFYKGDSIRELYKFHSSDTSYQYYNTTYFVTDQCDEIDFNGTNTWDSVKKVMRYHILQITDLHFQMRSFGDTAICDSCIITFQR